MTRIQIHEHLRQRCQRSINKTPLDLRPRMARLYSTMVERFMATLGADDRIEVWPEDEVTKAWGAFAAGFISGQEHPELN